MSKHRTRVQSTPPRQYTRLIHRLRQRRAQGKTRTTAGTFQDAALPVEITTEDSPILPVSVSNETGEQPENKTSIRKNTFTFVKDIKKVKEDNTPIDFDTLVGWLTCKALSCYSYQKEVIEKNNALKALTREAFNEKGLINYDGRVKRERLNDFKEFKQQFIEPIKEGLPAFIFGGFCEKGHDNYSLEYNGVVTIDIDFKEKGGDEKAAEVKTRLSSDPYIRLAGLSPSGFGVKAMVQTDNYDKEYYKDAERQVAAYLSQTYGYEIDGLSASVGTFWFYDPALYVNKKAQVFEIRIEKKAGSAEIKPADIEASELTRALDSIVAREDVVQAASYDDWCAIGYALYNLLGPDGFYYFDGISAKSPKYTERITRRTWQDIVRSRNRNKERSRQAGLSTLLKFIEAETRIVLNIKRNVIAQVKPKERFDYHFTVRKHLSEVKEELKNIRKHHKKVAVYADPGIGKTTLEEQLSNESPFRTCFMMPKVMLLTQFAERKGNEDIIRIYEKTPPEEREKAFFNKRNASTFHSVWKIIDSYGENDTLCVDEAHLVQNGQGYMQSACTDVYRAVMKTHASVVAISGTLPVGLYRAMGFVIVRVEREETPVVIINPFTYADLSNDHVARLYINSLDFSSDKVHLILLNSGNKQQDLMEYVIGTGRLCANQVDCIIASRKDSETYQDIVLSEKITEGRKLIFITIVGSEGINILNENIGCIAAFDVRCADTLRQFVRRPRSMKQVTIDLFLAADNPEKAPFEGDFEFLLNGEMNIARNLASVNNGLIGLYNDTNPDHFANTTLLHNLKDYLYFDQDTRQLEINIPGVYFRVKRNLDYLKTNEQYIDELRGYFGEQYVAELRPFSPFDDQPDPLPEGDSTEEASAWAQELQDKISGEFAIGEEHSTADVFDFIRKQDCKISDGQLILLLRLLFACRLSKKGTIEIKAVIGVVPCEKLLDCYDKVRSQLPMAGCPTPVEYYETIQLSSRERRKQARETFFDLTQIDMPTVLKVACSQMQDRKLISRIENTFSLPQTASLLSVDLETFQAADQITQEYEEKVKVQIRAVDKFDRYIYILSELKRLQFEDMYLVPLARKYGTSNANWRMLCDKLGYLQRAAAEQQGKLEQWEVATTNFSTVFTGAQYRLYNRIKRFLLDHFEFDYEYPVETILDALKEQFKEVENTSDTKLRHLVKTLFDCTIARKGKENKGIVVIHGEETLFRFLGRVYNEAEEERKERVEEQIAEARNGDSSQDIILEPAALSPFEGEHIAQAKHMYRFEKANTGYALKLATDHKTGISGDEPIPKNKSDSIDLSRPGDSEQFAIGFRESGESQYINNPPEAVPF